MKKNIKLSKLKYSLILLLVSITFFSCEDLVNEDPISEIAPDNFWKNNRDADAGVQGIYNAMATAYRNTHFLWGEFRSDNHIANLVQATGERLEVSNNSVTEGNDDVARWNRMYIVVNRANLAIEKIPTITGFDTDLLGEALAIRAHAYFTMVKVWGAVPLFTKPTSALSSDIYKARTDATTIFEELIIPDLIRAEELLGVPSNNYRFSKSSVLALQAEVYMWLKQPDKAKIVLDDIIALNAFSLVTSAQAWSSLFYNTSETVTDRFINIEGEEESARGKEQRGSELMFSLFFSQESTRRNLGDNNGNRSGISGLFNAGVPYTFISPTLENKWRERFPIDSTEWVTKYPNTPAVLKRLQLEVDPVLGTTTVKEIPVYGDYRYYLSREDFINLDINDIGEARVAKWHKTQLVPQFDDTDVVLYRYADMLLLLAEAENQLGNAARALELLNQIRAARELPLVPSAEFGASIDERENYILEERQYELLGEGKRFWDLVRTGKAVETMNEVYLTRPEAAPIDVNRLLLPIHFEHFQENPILGAQNPGYNN